MKNTYNLLTFKLTKIVIPSVVLNIIFAILLVFLVAEVNTEKEFVLDQDDTRSESIEEKAQISEPNVPTFLKQLSYTRSGIKFESILEKYETKTDDDIVITIEKIQNKSPYIVSHRLVSEFSGFSSIRELVEPVENNYFEGTIYNKKVNDQYFIRNYYPFKPGCSVKLMYETVILGENREYVYYVKLSSGWEDVCSLNNEEYTSAMLYPDIWFKKHQSEKFNLLDKFVKENF